MTKSEITIPEEIERKIEELVECYKENFDDAILVANAVYARINEDPDLKKVFHTVKSRVKSLSSFKHKLERKYYESLKDGGEAFDFTKENLFDKITDVAGVRILHIHTKEIEKIKPLLEKLLKKLEIELLEPPKANVWDIEYAKYYKDEVGIDTVDKKSLYTSVHYVIIFNNTVKPKCEIQIRTLIEETWGEVDHSFNYPDKINSIACQEQILALARITSGATRLIDSIFKSKKEFEEKFK